MKRLVVIGFSLLISLASGLRAGEPNRERVFKAPYEAVWKAANLAWDTLAFPTLRREEKLGLLESDTVSIPGDTVKAWMADAKPESWWQQGKYTLDLYVKPAGRGRTRVTAKMWLEGRGVPHEAMVSLRIREGKSNGKLESRVLDEVSRWLDLTAPRMKRR